MPTQLVQPPRSRTPMCAVTGVAVCVAGAAAAMALTRAVPVSPLLVAIVAGAVAVNLRALPARIRPGLDLSSRHLLRIGVALLGLRLAFSDIVGLGWGVLAVVVAVVVLGIAGTMYVGGLLGLTWTQRVLIACGFSICGAAAAAAADGVVEAEERELLATVALVVAFGTLMIPGLPLVAGFLGLTDDQAGAWAGASVHEVAQVVAAGGVIGGSALAVATAVKLARVLMLAPVMAWLATRRRGIGAEVRRPPLVPLFVVGFLACVALRSTGAVPQWTLDAANQVQTLLLGAGMFALGAGVRVAVLRSIDPRTVVLAALSTVWVAAVALGGVLLVS